MPIDLSGDERARPFRFDGGEVGCLLLHGFTGTPFEMLPIGEALAKRGYAVRAPLLPGHGTRVEDLARTTWPQWFAAALDGWTDLGRRSPTRVVCGLSMGALLAFRLAYERPREVRAVAALAPALELASQRSAEIARWVRWVPALPRWLAIVPKRPSKVPGVGRRTPAYDEIPLRSLASMLALQRRVRAELPAITAPVLVVDGGRDDTVSPAAATAIEIALGSTVKSRQRFERSGHILTEGVDAVSVVEAVADFFDEHTAAR
ncbi:MAG: alpha/beta fold hydrolase [Candidatus Binatia bacterium]